MSGFASSGITALRPGRDCPLDYRIASDAFNGPPQRKCESLYVIGGLYGNLQALHALDSLLLAEPHALVIFNGDVHWFDRDPAIFEQVEQLAARHVLLRGNVETELARIDDAGAGCGCAYPEEVTDQTVEWSNRIHQSLRETLHGLPALRAKLAERPPHALFEVAGHRVAVSHGDEFSLAGWQCSRQALQRPERQGQLAAWMDERSISVLATSHTCAPVALSWGRGAVINNGAAGMPNFSGAQYGVISRIAATPCDDALYRTQVQGLYIEAIALRYDHAAFLTDFRRQWPEGSPAALAYEHRLQFGPIDNASAPLLGGFLPCAMPIVNEPDLS
jgi:predicted phosphodiesterase